MEPEVLPGDHEEQAVEHDVGIGEPLLDVAASAPTARMSVVEQAVGSQDLAPHHAGDDLGQDVGSEEERAQHRAGRGASGSAARRGQRERDLQRSDSTTRIALWRSASRKACCGRRLAEVVEADEVGRAARARSSRTGCSAALWTIGYSTNTPYSASAGARNSTIIGHGSRARRRPVRSRRGATERDAAACVGASRCEVTGGPPVGSPPTRVGTGDQLSSPAPPGDRLGDLLRRCRPGEERLHGVVHRSPDVGLKNWSRNSCTNVASVRPVSTSCWLGSVTDSSAPLGHRQAAVLAPRAGVVDVGDELEEVDRLGRGVLADREAVAAAERVGAAAGAAVDAREREPAELERQIAAVSPPAVLNSPGAHWPMRSMAALPLPTMPPSPSAPSHGLARKPDWKGSGRSASSAPRRP